jgi:hypothetical protein
MHDPIALAGSLFQLESDRVLRVLVCSERSELHLQDTDAS